MGLEDTKPEDVDGQISHNNKADKNATTVQMLVG